ncbi:MAG: efflux RND transporter permease subunit [Leptospiraceae bacterium]|nr:efflux RND transporter permease subunit [Leptospiraceae bacterium]
MIRFFVSRPIASLMLACALVLLGLLGMLRLRITLFPALQVPRIYVLTRFSGMAPSQVEHMVTIPLEQAAGSVRGLEEMQSRSERGLSVIKLSFEWGTDRDLAMVQLRQKLDQSFATLPEGASRSILIPFDPSRQPVMVLHLDDRDRGKRLRFFAESVIRPELEQIKGIAAVEIRGGWRRQINVLLDAPALYGHGLDVLAVAEALNKHNVTAPVGTIKQGDFEKTVRIDARARSVEDLRSVPVGPGEERSRVLLSEVGRVEDGYADREGTTLVQGRPSVILKLRKEPGANTLETARRIRHSMRTINRKHDKHARLSVLSDNSKLVRDSISAAERAALLGSGIAFVLLMLFLSNWRSAIIASSSIPIALIIALGFLQILDVSLNLMSLSGLALGAGLLIDGSIMVCDSIDTELERQGSHIPGRRSRQSREDLQDSIISGTCRVAGSLWASTLTTVVVFFPVVFVSGIAAALFQDLALAVIAALMAGLFCSVVVIPVLSFLIFERRLTLCRENTGATARNSFRRLEAFRQTFAYVRIKAKTALTYLENAYAVILAWSLRQPGAVLSMVCLASLFGLLLLAALPRSLMPSMDAGAVKAELFLPPGTPYIRTASIAASLQKAMQRRGMVRSSVSQVGHEERDVSEELMGPMYQNQATLQFFPASHISSEALANQLRLLVSKDHPLPLEITLQPGPIQNLLGTGENEYILKVSNTGNVSGHLRALGKAISALPGVLKVERKRLVRRPVLNVKVDRMKAARSGVSPARIADLLRRSLRGSRASLFRLGDRSLDIRVRLSSNGRKSRKDIYDIQFRRKKGMLSLQSLVRTREGFTDPARIRRNQKAVNQFRFKIAEGNQKKVLSNVRNRAASFLQGKGSPARSAQGPGVSSKRGFEIEAANRKAVDSLKGLAGAFALSCILIFQLLAGQFESLLHAGALLLSIPSLLIGAGLALLVTGSGLNISSGMGILMLGGIVINASIALFEEMQRLKPTGNARDDACLRESIVAAGRSRLRPILLTTLTTVGGVAPLAAGLGAGSENQQPLGISMVGGLIVGTAVALIAFPCFYYLGERRRR